MPLLIPLLLRFRKMESGIESEEDEDDEDLNHKDVNDMIILAGKYVEKKNAFRKYQESTKTLQFLFIHSRNKNLGLRFKIR